MFLIFAVILNNSYSFDILIVDQWDIREHESEITHNIQFCKINEKLNITCYML